MEFAGFHTDRFEIEIRVEGAGCRIDVKVEDFLRYTFRPYGRGAALKLRSWLFEIPELLWTRFPRNKLQNWICRGRRIPGCDGPVQRLVEIAREATLGMPLADFQLFGEAEYLYALLECLLEIQLETGRSRLVVFDRSALRRNNFFKFFPFALLK